MTTSAVAPSPGSPLYDFVLILHVVVAIVGFGSIAVTGLYAELGRQRASSPHLGGVARFFDGRINWPPRALYGVPVLGAVLVALSDDGWTFGQPWLLASMGIWVAAIALAEKVVWPSERRIGETLSGDSGAPRSARLRSLCLRLEIAAAAEAVLFIVATVVMVAKPGIDFRGR